MLRSPSSPGEDDIDSAPSPQSTKTGSQASHGASTSTNHLSSRHSTSSTASASANRRLYPVDYLSLSDALQDDLSALEEQENQEDSTDSVLDRDSIELASSDEDTGSNNGIGNSCGGHAGDNGHSSQVRSETLLEFLGQQGDLEQRMNAIEALESCHDDHGADNNLVVPTYIRVMYMGAASAKDKRLLFRKLSKALAFLFNHDDSSSLFRNPNVFKERKHHILLMSLLPEDGDDDIVETCEDNGLSIIEADFTWSTGSLDRDDKLNAMISHYLWLQCEDPWITATAATDSPFRSSPPSAEGFDGFIYPEKSMNGVDLCVYFYDGSILNPDEDARVEEDLAVLWLLKRLAIPIIPILSGGRRGNRPSSSSALRSVADRRSQLAELLAQYKIRCIDISQSNLDIGRPPSFQRGARHRPVMDHANLEKRLGKEWANSSVTTPAPYNILTIDQFSALDRHVIINILRQSRQKAMKKKRVLKAIRSHCPSSSSAANTTSTSTTSTTTSLTNAAAGALPNCSSVIPVCFFPSLLLLLLGTVLVQYPSTTYHPWSTHFSPWTATLILSVSNRSLLLTLQQDNHYNIAIPLPACLPSTDASTSLATLVLDHPPQVDLAINGQQQQSTCPSSNVPLFPPTPSAWLAPPPSPNPPDLADATPGPLENFYRTTTFLFRRPKKFFKVMWERGRGE
ncbi:hypothetical protein BX666DRAFT_899433 [Dichotomocladium elegans]|nr:hypothetical protein BX666DRAFT_899433 [Dichotomocladium elegans]